MTSGARSLAEILFADRRSQLGLVVALVLLLVSLALVQGAPQVERPYDLGSNGPQGLLALRLWLAEMGYQVEETGSQRFALPREADLLWVYPGERPFSAAEAAAVRRWVEGGGALIMVGPSAQADALIDAFCADDRRVSTASTPVFGAEVRQVQPLLPDAPPTWPLLRSGLPLELDQAGSAVTALAVDDGTPTAALQPVGQGVVWYLSPLHSLVNAELRDENQAKLVPALLRHVPDGGLVVFDTFHQRSEAAPEPAIDSVRDWLYRSPVGQGVLLAGLLVIGYLVLQGRRLGPPLPIVSELRRREAAEYVRAIAALYRRSRQRSAIARHQKRRLKKGVGRPLRIDPDLADDEFVAQLRNSAHRYSQSDVSVIGDLLARLDRDEGESDLVATAREIDQLLARSSPPGVHRSAR